MNLCDIEAISMFIDGELPEMDAARLRGHLSECPSCRALLKDLTAVKEGFALLDDDPPDTLLPGILYKIELGEEPPRRRRIIGSLAGVAACAAILLILSQTGNLPTPDSSYLNDSPGSGEAGLETQSVSEALDDAKWDADNGTMTEPGGGMAWAEGDSSSVIPGDAGSSSEDLLGMGLGSDPPEPNPAPAPPAAGDGDGFGYDEFLHLLDESGLWYLVDAEMLIREDFPLAAARNIYVGDEQLMVYESDGAAYPPPPFRHFKNSELLVQYGGEDRAILAFLTEAFGAPFAGTP